MNANERYRVLMNIVAQKGIEGDLFSELARAEAMINAIDQGKMMPPPLPPEITEPIEPTMSQPPEEEEPLTGKYDNI